MNVVVLQGRLTREPETRFTQSQMAVCTFTLAVDRAVSREKRDAGEQTADFIRCIAFGRTAEIIDKYFTKGNRMLISGHIQTGSYKNKDGQNVYTTDVIVDRFDFIESRQERQQGNYQQNGYKQNNYQDNYQQEYKTRPPRPDEDIPEGFAVIDESEIPF